jgi:hypothetical protein
MAGDRNMGRKPSTLSLCRAPTGQFCWLCLFQRAYRSSVHRNPLQAVISQNDSAQNLLGITEVPQAGLDAGRNVARGRMRLDLSQGLKFKVA